MSAESSDSAAPAQTQAGAKATRQPWSALREWRGGERDRKPPARDLESLSRDVSRMRTILGAITDGVLAVRPDGLIDSVSIVALRLFDTDLVDIAGQHVSSLLRGLPTELSMQDLFATAGETGMECIALTPEGEEIPVHVTVASPAEEALYFFVLRDLRPVVAAQQKALQNERLAAVGEMVAALAHESRNALQRMQSCLTLLTFHVDGDAEVVALLDDLQDAQDQLHRLYEDVRDYAAPLDLQRRPLDVRVLLEATWEDLYLLWVPKALSWSIDALPGLPRLMADRARLEQVFRNVLENAIHFSPPEGNIACRISELTIGGSTVIRVRLEDDGPGLTKEAAERAFDLLFTKSDGGSGMGLTIAKRIVQQHDGQIGIGNRDGGTGTVVTIDIPATANP